MFKIKDNVDLKELKKFNFKEVQQNKIINYVYSPNKNVWDFTGNMIVINNDRNLFNYDYYLDEDRQIRFRLNECATYDFEKVINVLYDLIQAGMVEKI